MDKFRLKGSILQSIKLKASTATQIVLSGSTNQIIKLKASVVTFATSLTTRASILPKVTLFIKAMSKKNIKNLLTQSRVAMIVTLVVDKFSKAFLNIKATILVRASVEKNARAIIEPSSAFGASSVLRNIKDKTLGQIKTLTLKELTFAIGVRAFVIKKTTSNIFERVTITVNATLVRKTKLSDIKNQTLGEIKTKTLKELTEYDV